MPYDFLTHGTAANKNTHAKKFELVHESRDCLGVLDKLGSCHRCVRVCRVVFVLVLHNF
jgi:hypothetical protein